MKRTNRRDAEKETRWRNLIAQHQQSGLSVREFCRKHAIRESAFYAWRREIALRDREAGNPQCDQSAATFLPLQVIDAPSGHARGSIEIVAPDGWRLRIAKDADGTQVAELLGHLRRLGHSGEPRP